MSVYLLCELQLTFPPVLDVCVSLDEDGPLYAGSSLTISCTVKLNPIVNNNNETVRTNWSGIESIPHKRYTINSTKLSHTTYITHLIIHTLTKQDSGNYTCSATIIGEAEPASKKDDVIVDVLGSLQFLYLLLFCS